MVMLGIALLVIGAGLLVAEAHLPTYGLLGVTGFVAAVAGTALAIDGAGAGLVLVLVVTLTLAALGGALLYVAGRQTLAAVRSRTLTGAEGLVGRLGVVRAAPDPLGQVFVDGALWRARPCWGADEELNEGDPVVVERVQGLTLGVRRAEEWELEA
ncbi:MAG TPA: NfeD family protein [Thermoleophilaceae bacterium]|nr:NfeD family protein [Thermoleophilaceae bacterium]